MQALRRLRTAAGLAAALVATVTGTSAWALADYPTRPVRLIVSFSAGSAADTVSRAMAEELARQLGVAVSVDNREGAGGSLGNAAAAKAVPDGYTLLMGTSLMAMSVHTTAPPLYDVMRDA